MFSTINEHIEKALLEYGQGDYFLSMLKAKTEYFQLTGTVNEEDDEYESRMNCFNDWYLFQYALPGKTATVIGEYLQDKTIEPELAKSLLSINYSLFEYSKRNFKDQIILEDILHDEKITLPPNHEDLALVPKDFFIGRLVTFQQESFLLKGKCIFPMEVKSICKKQAKKVRKLKSKEAETSFLLTLEALKTKWSRYTHVSVNKIFTFTN